MIKNIGSLFTAPLSIDPVYFVENWRTIDGEPFRITNNGRDYLVDFYRSLCISALKDKKPVVVVKGRQVEATEAALNVALYFLCNYKFFNVLHAFPTETQVSRFSKERLQGAIRFSKPLVPGDPGQIEQCLADHRNASNTVSTVEFRNHNFYYMYSAWAEADSLRGISVDALMRDEFQDWSPSAIANTEASTSQSKYAVEFSFGTPKSANSPFEDIWKNSDQRYFHSRCVSCSKLFQITMDNFLYHDIVKCTQCGKEQTKTDANRGGAWVPTKSVGKEGRVGYHISQLIHPAIPRERITRQQDEWSDSKFKNEVLGEFFTGGTLPLNPADVKARCCEPYRLLDFPGIVSAPRETFIGIDWGSRSENKDTGAYTVATILEKVGEKYQLVRAEKLMQNEYVARVARIRELITLYNCIAGVADIGFGQVECQMLQAEYGPMIKSAYYAPNAKEKMSYNEKNWMLTIDRNAWIEELIDIINRGQLVIPFRRPAEIEWLVDHMCNTEIRVAHRTGNVFKSYEKVNAAEPNDGLHSLNYAYIASVVHLGHNVLGRSPMTSKLQGAVKGGVLLGNFNGKPWSPPRGGVQQITRSDYGRRG